jgi:hypothetical protein
MVKLMKTTIRLIVFLVILSTEGYGQATQIGNDNAQSTSAVNYKVARFDLTDSTLIEGLSNLSSEPIAGLHLGIEEILREKMPDPQDQSVRFSLSLENKTVGDILDTLCQFDSRYTWSTEGPSIDIYPRQIIGNSSYLLNGELEQITLKNILDPYQALTPLARLLPGEQLGYAGVGGDGSYREPWSVAFTRLTVRQLMNRVSEHIGPRGGWIWGGSNDQRFVFFFKFGFNR